MAGRVYCSAEQWDLWYVLYTKAAKVQLKDSTGAGRVEASVRGGGRGTRGAAV